MLRKFQNFIETSPDEEIKQWMYVAGGTFLTFCIVLVLMGLAMRVLP